MASPSSSHRFKTDMPRIPGIDSSSPRRPNLFANVNLLAALGIGIVFVAVLIFFVARSVFRPKRVESAVADPAPQIVIPTPESETRPGPPVATESHPEIATTAELSAPWSAKEFFFQDPVTRENVSAVIVHLPAGPRSQRNSYWAFSQRAPFGNCKLEYIVDLQKLSAEYDFRAKHPMVGNPCSRTVFDPLRLRDLPGNVWVRGAVAQGSDLRPPMAIEVRVAGNRIQALRME